MASTPEEFAKYLTEYFGGEVAVYFRPPTDYRITKYPCLIFDYDADSAVYADGIKYQIKMRYKMDLMIHNAADKVVAKYIELPGSTFVNTRQSAGLNTLTRKIQF